MTASSLFVNGLLSAWLLAGAWLTWKAWPRGEGKRARRFLVFLAISGPFLVAYLTRRAGLGREVPVDGNALAWLGGAVMLAGVVLWMHSITILGEGFSLDMDAREDGVVATGPYGVIRHPAYAGMIVVLSGYGLSTGDWVVALEFLAIPLAAFLYRIPAEERGLVERFGEEYVDYTRRTKRLIPFVY